MVKEVGKPCDDTDPVEEFTTLFAQCQRQLHSYILALVFDTGDAYDVLQDTNLVLWQKFHEYERGTSFLAWARGIARYRVLRYRQLQGRREVPLDPATLEQLALAVSDESDDEAEARRDALIECLGKLNEPDRRLVQTRYAPGASVRVIAAGLRRSENAISQALRRIRGALLDCVKRTLQSREVGRIL